MRALGLLLSLVLSFCIAPLNATTIRVPADQPTIQAGINVAVDEDTVLVADGIYSGDGNRDIDFLGKAIVVTSENGPWSCLINCEGNFANHRRGFFFQSGEDANSIVQGFTIVNGFTSRGGAIRCLSSSPTIRGNLLTMNSAAAAYPGYGGGIHCSDSSPIISGNMIISNVANFGGGISLGSGSEPTIVSNTIWSNSANFFGGGMVLDAGTTPIITNTILWDNTPEEIYTESAVPIVSYSDIQGGWEGEGNIDETPMFVLSDKNDYRLLWDSPCIDTGHPDSLDADGTRSDIGAHFFNQDDYLTVYVTPDKMWTRPGEQFGVTYTAINRWDSPGPCWLLSQVLLPGGSALNVLGPNQYTLPANYTAQVHVNHPVPMATPGGVYEYLSQISDTETVKTVYDTDSFKFWVIE